MQGWVLVSRTFRSTVDHKQGLAEKGHSVNGAFRVLLGKDSRRIQLNIRARLEQAFQLRSFEQTLLDTVSRLQFLISHTSGKGQDEMGFCSSDDNRYISACALHSINEKDLCVTFCLSTHFKQPSHAELFTLHRRLIYRRNSIVVIIPHPSI